MKVRVEKNIVEFYSSAETLSITRYQKFNKYLMIDDEVGSSVSDYDKRLQKTIQYVKHDLKKEALIELENSRQCVYSCANEYSAKNMALCLLVKRINDEHFTTIDAQTLGRIQKKLDEIGFTKKMLDETIETVKKKIETALEQYYPEHFSKNNSIQYNSHFKGKLFLELDGLIEKRDNAKKVLSIEKNMLSVFPVNIWNVYVKGNMEKKMEVDFLKFLFSISQHTNIDVENLSVFKFYALIDQLKEQTEK